VATAELVSVATAELVSAARIRAEPVRAAVLPGEAKAKQVMDPHRVAQVEARGRAWVAAVAKRQREGKADRQGKPPPASAGKAELQDRPRLASQGKSRQQARLQAVSEDKAQAGAQGKPRRALADKLRAGM